MDAQDGTLISDDRDANGVVSDGEKAHTAEGSSKPIDLLDWHKTKNHTGNDVGNSDEQFVSDLTSQFGFFCTVITSTNEKKQEKDAAADNGLIENTPAFTSYLSSKANDDSVNAMLASRRLNTHLSPQDYEHNDPLSPVKYMLDYTLNKFTRWLRILGIDAALETAEEEIQRTKFGKSAIFDRCKKERRTLITTSYRLTLRSGCPPGAYLVDAKKVSKMELSLAKLLRTHGVELVPRKFLTICVICNGDIFKIENPDEKREVFEENGAPNLGDELEVFRCNGCRQGYWWDDRPSSSASRVFLQATKLFKQCLRGGVRIKDEDEPEKRRLYMGAFDFVDAVKERQKGLDESGGENAIPELAVIKWLRSPKLSNPLGGLRSAYAMLDEKHLGGNDEQSKLVGESLPFTNVTSEFIGTLDYIFFESPMFEQTAKLVVPKSLREMNPSMTPAGHLIPSDTWPSDHLAIGARLRLKDTHLPKQPLSPVPQITPQSKTLSPAKEKKHPPRCGCGCVPQIYSLFEMAELRKQAREKAKLKK